MLFALWLMIVSIATATTLEVGTGKTYSTIGSAVSAASDGDTIKIYAGTYKECVTVSSMALTFTGVSGASSTVLDAAGTCTTALTLTSSSSTVSGLTIANLGKRAVYITSGSPAFVDTTVGYSGATTLTGGGLYISSATVTFTGGKIVSNKGSYGGGVYLTGTASMSVDGTTVSSNTAAQYGAAFYLDTGAGNTSLSLSDVTFGTNTPSKTGEAVYLEKKATLTSSGCTITASTRYPIVAETSTSITSTDDSIAGATGLYLSGTLDAVGLSLQLTTAGSTYYGIYGDSTSVISLADAEVWASGVVTASAVYAAGTLDVSGSSFSGLEAADGAAIQLVGADAIITSSSFSDNTANDDYGGAIYAQSDATLNLEDVSFTGNQAGTGGAVFSTRSTVSGSGLSFEDNAADSSGGALYLSLSTSASVFSDVLFQGNTTSSNSAGAISSSGTDLTMSEARFYDNVGGYAGGAIKVSGDVVITDSVFRGNSATGSSGGALNYYAGSSSSTSTLTLERVRFEENVGVYRGGALYAEGGIVILSFVDFLDNRVTPSTGGSAFGGGLAVSLLGSITVENSRFCGNSAELGGAVSEVNNLDVGVARNAWKNNLFMENTASSTGGALYLYLTANHQTMNSVFVGNTAGSTGAAVELKTSEATFYNSVFDANDGSGAVVYGEDSTSASTVLGYNDWYANADSDIGGTLTATTSTGGNITSDPLFTSVSLDGDCTNDDFHPLSSSPLIDAGNPDYYDLDDSTSDIGLYGGSGSADYDEDEDGYTAETDCDDTDPDVYPGAPELCNGEDDNCDAIVDADASGESGWFPDADGDGYGDADAPATADCETSDTLDDTDCDDTSGSVHPGATEIAYDDLDQDCSGDDLTDVDGDGYDAIASGGEDCDDGDPETFPDAAEIPYDGVDQDCSGADLLDADGDGSDALSMGGDDCNDLDATVSPSTAESCDGVDDDCDGLTDEPDASDASTWYMDADGDGYGDASSTERACEAPAGTVADATDCDDADADVHPGATEVCDASDTDEDCDGRADDDDAGVARGTWYPDDDGDGYGDGGAGRAACDLPSGYVVDATDCDDDDGDVHPGSTEVCDAADTDEDCDGRADDDDSSTASSGKSTGYADADGDGYGDSDSPMVACDLPGGYAALGGDCDDGDVGVHPGGTEICDAADTDEDCDGLADDDDSSTASSGASTWYADADGDGYGDASDATIACDAPDGYGASSTDCDDRDADVHPGALEVCDAADTDEDCDGRVDDDDSSTASSGKVTYYADADGDGYGDPSTARALCEAAAGLVADATDCDDGDASVSPGATEVCDAADTDEDCDGRADDADSSTAITGRSTYHADADGDGHGSESVAKTACDLPDGYVTSSDDCDDGDASAFPGATEVCDAADTDEDCDGLADDADSSVSAASTSSWYADLDRDGYGDASSTTLACAPPSGHVTDATDCDDGAPLVHPDATEICDASDTDEDCDGLADDADGSVSVSTASTWYADGDGDGYGADSASTFACDAPDDHTALGGDCEDEDPAFHPGAEESCDVPEDYNCDGSVGYADEDGDGWAACEDCDDADADVSPDGVELCDGLDDDCDGETDEDSAVDALSWYYDGDGDGYGDGSEALSACDAPEGYAREGTDCDDADPAWHPGATESCDDPNDYDCDGTVAFADADADGWAACEECDDADALVSPEAEERCDGVDNDCDGITDDAESTDAHDWYVDEDGDGYGTVGSSVLSCEAPVGYVSDASDCDDGDADFNPGAEEFCDDPSDYNCDGSVGYADEDEDGWAACEECDDTDASISPEAVELCNGKDDDCEGTVDEGALDEIAWYLDSDRDGYGDSEVTITACDAPEDYVAAGADCDDADVLTWPGAPETCDDPEDHNCDGSVGYADADGDGWAACLECDDSDATVNPGAEEVCDGVDDDCEGTVDEGASDAETWYADADGDGYGDAASAAELCGAPDGYASEAGDCDDASDAVSPEVDEVCGNGLDDDCDGATDLADEDCAGDSGETGETGGDTGVPADDSGEVETGEPEGDSAPDTAESGSADVPTGKEPPGCGCATTTPARGVSVLLLLLPLLALVRRAPSAGPRQSRPSSSPEGR